MLERIKKHLIATRLGQTIGDAADTLALRRVPLHNPEQAAAAANHIIARRLIRGLCPSGGQFLDVGAHIGSVLASVHRADGSIRIAAIEADPDKAAFLRQQYPFVHLVECAAGERAGRAEFFTYAAGSGYNSLAQTQGDAPSRRIEVAVERLDDVLADISPDLIKIDVEGAELGVLIGAEALVARARPVIMFESVGLQTNELGYAPGMIWDWLDAHGYAVRTPDRVAHDCAALGRESFLDAHAYPFRSHDYFAIPHEKAESVRDRARRILRVHAP